MVPKLFTEENRITAIAAYRLGASDNLAAASIGVNSTTIRAWLKKGLEELLLETDPETEHATFFKSVQIAKWESAQPKLNKIREEAESNWKAAAWWLERLYPNDYGARRGDLIQDMEITKREGAQLRIIEVRREVVARDDGYDVLDDLDDD